MVGACSCGDISVADLFVLQFLQLQQHPPEVFLDGLFFHAQFDGGLCGELPAMSGDVEVERIDIHALFRRCQDVELHLVESQILRQSANAVAPMPQLHGHFVAAYVGFDLWWCWWQRRGGEDRGNSRLWERQGRLIVQGIRFLFVQVFRQFVRFLRFVHVFLIIRFIQAIVGRDFTPFCFNGRGWHRCLPLP